MLIVIYKDMTEQQEWIIAWLAVGGIYLMLISIIRIVWKLYKRK